MGFLGIIGSYLIIGILFVIINRYQSKKTFLKVFKRDWDQQKTQQEWVKSKSIYGYAYSLTGIILFWPEIVMVKAKYFIIKLTSEKDSSSMQNALKKHRELYPEKYL